MELIECPNCGKDVEPRFDLSLCPGCKKEKCNYCVCTCAKKDSDVSGGKNE